MAIDIGDAVLTFLGDTTQLDAAFEKVSAEAGQKLAPAEAATQSLGTEMKAVGEAATVAGAQTAAAGAEMAAGMEEATFSMHEAKGEIALIGELTGVHLPRHVRSFVAELPGVGAALNAAFAATAIIFIIEALAQGIEKIIEWREEAHKLELGQQDFNTAVLTSFNNLDDKLLRAGIKIDQLRGDHLDALKKELELIDHQSLSELQHQFDLLAQAADAVFKQLATSWHSFDAGSKGAQNALTDFKSQYDLLLAQGKDKEANDLLAGTLQSARDTLAQMEKAKQQADEIHKSIVAAGVADTYQGGPGEKQIQAQRDLVSTLEAQVKAHEKINELTTDDKAIKITEEANRAAEEADRIAKSEAESYKRGIEEEDREDDERRNRFIADLQAQEKEKIAATKQGSQERIQVIDAAIKEEEAHGLQDTAFYKSLQVERIQAVQARIAQIQAAQNKANADALKNDEQEAKRDLESVKSSATEQEKAISDLGKFKMLSQAETSKLLLAAYEDEKNRTVAVLQNLLNEERALMERAAKELAAAKLNPAVTPEQIAQAETLLNQLKNAVANTENQIEKTKKDSQAKQLALDHSYYGESVTLAIAAGNRELAEQLKLAQSQLQAAKARGENTKAIEQQIKALEKEAHALQVSGSQLQRFLSELKQGGGLEKLFERDLASGSKALQNFGAVAQFTFDEFGSAFENAVAQAELREKDLGSAMAEATAQVLAQISARALIWGMYYTAQGIADAFWNPARAGADFTAAAEFFAIGGAAGIAAHALAGAGSGGGSASAGAAGTSGSAAPAAGSPNVTGSSAPAPTLNVVHLASGGLVDKPTLAVVGDAAGGGRAREAVLPLDNHEVMRSIAGAIAAHASASGNQEIHVVIHSDLVRTVQQINRGTKSGRLRLHSTSSDRTIRKA